MYVIIIFICPWSITSYHPTLSKIVPYGLEDMHRKIFLHWLQLLTRGSRRIQICTFLVSAVNTFRDIQNIDLCTALTHFPPCNILPSDQETTDEQSGLACHEFTAFMANLAGPWTPGPSSTRDLCKHTNSRARNRIVRSADDKDHLFKRYQPKCFLQQFLSNNVSFDRQCNI